MPCNRVCAPPQENRVQQHPPACTLRTAFHRSPYSADGAGECSHDKAQQLHQETPIRLPLAAGGSTLPQSERCRPTKQPLSKAGLCITRHISGI